MKTNKATILGVALIASCALHAIQFIRTAHEVTKASLPAATDARAGAPETRPLRAPGIDSNAGASILDRCNKQLVSAQSDLAAAQEQLAQRRDQRARFDEAAREAAMEQRIGPAVEAALSKMPGVLREVECRGDICKVHLSARTRDEARVAWKSLTKDPQVGELTDIFTNEPGDPVVDAVSGKGGFDMDSFLNTRSAADATAEIQALVDRFRASGEIDRCAALSPERDVLEVKVFVLPEQGQLSTSVGGPLARTVVGNCITEALRIAIAQYRAPGGTKYGAVYASLQPHGA